jgi:hypothetical protein
VQTIRFSSVTFFIIGGAVLLYRGLKPGTKDIDIVLQNTKDFTVTKELLAKNGFTPEIATQVYKNMNVSEIMVRDDFRIDLFDKKVCDKFSLSTEMMNRGESIGSFKNIKLLLCSNEDIFSFKTMTEREGDIEDCQKLATEGLDWSIVLEEIKNQIKISGNSIWITWIGERMELLEDRGIQIPIMGDIHKMVLEYYKKI